MEENKITYGVFVDENDRIIGLTNPPLDGYAFITEEAPDFSEHNLNDYKTLYTEETVTDEEGNEVTEKHYTGEFVLEPIEIPVPVTMPTAEERLEALEAVLLEMMGV